MKKSFLSFKKNNFTIVFRLRCELINSNSKVRARFLTENQENLMVTLVLEKGKKIYKEYGWYRTN